MQAVHDVQLGDAGRLHLLGQPHGFLDAHRVRVLLAGLALEGAVGAGGVADVRQVEVTVDVEEDPVAVALGAHAVSQAAEPGQVVAGVQILAIGSGQALAGFDLGFELFFSTLCPHRSD